MIHRFWNSVEMERYVKICKFSILIKQSRNLLQRNGHISIFRRNEVFKVHEVIFGIFKVLAD